MSHMSSLCIPPSPLADCEWKNQSERSKRHNRPFRRQCSMNTSCRTSEETAFLNSLDKYPSAMILTGFLMIHLNPEQCAPSQSKIVCRPETLSLMQEAFHYLVHNDIYLWITVSVRSKQKTKQRRGMFSFQRHLLVPQWFDKTLASFTWPHDLVPVYVLRDIRLKDRAELHHFSMHFV